MPKLTGNKGEWSEIYVFLRLLEIGKLFAADEDLNKNESVFYDVLEIIRNENVGVLEFIYNKITEEISVINKNTNSQLLVMSVSAFKTEADHLYNKIIEASNSAFSIVQTEKFLNELYITSLKAKSSDKADIRIRIQDIRSHLKTIQGFSIKSRLGSPSTLINAGKTTNFIYEVTGLVSDEIMNKFNTCSNKFRDRFDVLKSCGCDIEYRSMENSVFQNNLCLLDGDLPRICSVLLKEYYWSGISNVKQALQKITELNPFEYDLSKGHPFYGYKFKKLLTECALGMLPAKTWNGKADATGGYIIVREDGEVLCYHLFNRNEFENYLINNTKFETASTSRHEFGCIYKENSKYYIKLNLQIRFIK